MLTVGVAIDDDLQIIIVKYAQIASSSFEYFFHNETPDSNSQANCDSSVNKSDMTSIEFKISINTSTD